MIPRSRQDLGHLLALQSLMYSYRKSFTHGSEVSAGLGPSSMKLIDESLMYAYRKSFTHDSEVSVGLGPLGLQVEVVRDSTMLGYGRSTDLAHTVRNAF